MKFQATTALLLSLFGVNATSDSAAKTLRKVVVYPLQDSTIFEDEDDVAKGVGSNVVGMTEHGARRTLVQFDLSKVPIDVEVKKVVLKIDVQHSKGEPKVELLRLTSPWSSGSSSGDGEGSSATNGDTTWKYRTYSSMPWNEVGGDFDPEVLSTEDSGFFGSTSQLESVMQDMILGVIPNYGFLLVGNEKEEVAFQTIGSMEGKRSEMPRLELEYETTEEEEEKSAVAVGRKHLLKNKIRTRKLDDSDEPFNLTACIEEEEEEKEEEEINAGDNNEGSGDANAGDGGGGQSDCEIDGAIQDVGNQFFNAPCFSGKNMVEVLGRGSVRMDSLKIGDSVLSGIGHYTKVYGFGHYEKNQKSNYLQIQTDMKNQTTVLEISEDHMVFVIIKGSTKSVPASSIKVGDTLLVTGSSSKVTEIKTVQRRGVYAPFTYSGDIVVSGVVASNYISMIPEEDLPFGVTMQWIAHTFNAPRRLVCSVNFHICENETYTEDGVSTWIDGPFQAGRWLSRQNRIIKMAGSGLLAAIMAVLFYFPLVLGFFLSSKLIKTTNKKKIM